MFVVAESREKAWTNAVICGSPISSPGDHRGRESLRAIFLASRKWLQARFADLWQHQARAGMT